MLVFISQVHIFAIGGEFDSPELLFSANNFLCAWFDIVGVVVVVVFIFRLSAGLKCGKLQFIAAIEI